MASAKGIANHEAPIWRHKADFLIHVDLSPWGLPGKLEQLWTRRVSDNQFELCCVPFFPNGLHLGDIVETEPQGEWRFMVRRVIKESGRLDVRVAVNVHGEEEVLTPVLLEALHGARCDVEMLRPGYLAVDVPSAASERVLLVSLGE